MRVFLSYHEDEEGDSCALVLREELGILGINAIMAKHSIRPGANWAQTILDHLEESSALLCIASRGYTKSPWCQQEIGWAIGRDIPALWVRYNSTEHSVGFLMANQELIPTDSLNQAEIAREVCTWLATHQKTHEEARASLLRALAGSSTYQQTRDIASVLATLGSLTDDEWRQIDEAAENNRQVGEAYYYSDRVSGISITDWLRRKLNKSEATAWPWRLPLSVLQTRGGGRARSGSAPAERTTTSRGERGSTR